MTRRQVRQWARKTIRRSQNEYKRIRISDSSESSNDESQPQQQQQQQRRRKQAAPRRQETRNQRIDRLQDGRFGSIPLAPLLRVIKEILQINHGGQYKIQAAAIQCLRIAAESYLVNFFEDANLLTQHSKRVTLMYKDFELLLRLRKSWGDPVAFAKLH
uniref:Histone H2A/H2B/H3 domain-containing protein n=1 Tax=Panagrolaimus sp. PS1159 TaxID=55785 RepID=A0AC35G1B4_9BILA